MSASMSDSELSSSSTSDIPSSLWILDYGVSHHMSPHMLVEAVDSTVSPYISLKDVYYIPTLALNLASGSQLCNFGCCILFTNSLVVYMTFSLGG